MKSIKNLKNIRKWCEDLYKDEADDKLRQRRIVKRERELLAEWEKLETAPIPIEVHINIEWRKSRVWGNNPHAEGRAIYADGHIENFTATAPGYGYDKHSTVIAGILNQCMRGAIVKAIAKGSKLASGITNYSPGVIPPCFEGGVGMSCYDDGGGKYVRRGYSDYVMTSIGGTMDCTASGKTFDAWLVKYPVRRKKEKTT